MTKLEMEIVDAITKAAKFESTERIITRDGTIYELSLIYGQDSKLVTYYDTDYFRLCKVNSTELGAKTPVMHVMDIASDFDYGSTASLIAAAIKHDNG